MSSKTYNMCKLGLGLVVAAAGGIGTNFPQYSGVASAVSMVAGLAISWLAQRHMAMDAVSGAK